MPQMIMSNLRQRAEFARAAEAMYERGENRAAHLLSAVAAVGYCPITQFDRASEVYRAWLVFNEVKPSTDCECAQCTGAFVITEQKG